MNKKYKIFIASLFMALLIFSSCSSKSEVIEGNDILEKFTFDELEITIGKNYSFDIIDNEFDKDNKKEVVKLPINVKNLKNEEHHLSMIYYTIKSPNKVKLASKARYYNDSIDYAENLPSEKSYTKYIYFVYEKDGVYSLDFNNGNEKKEVYIEIKKK